MTNVWTQFANLTTATTPSLDTDLQTLAAMGIFPCAVSGTANAITLTPLAGMPPVGTGSPVVSGYNNYMRFVGVATGTNNSAVTIQVGALAALPVYNDTPAGPIALTGGEIVQNCAFSVIYDLALNSGAGGFHLSSIVNAAINPASIKLGGNLATLTAIISNLFTVAYTVVPANSTQDVAVATGFGGINDPVIIGLPATVTAGLMFEARVTGVQTITLRAANITGSSIAAFTVIPRLTVVRSVP